MNILYIAHRIPYPPNKGDKIRSFHQIQHLSRKHVVYLACLIDEREDFQHVKTLERYCASVDAVYREKAAAIGPALLALFSSKSLSVASFHSRELERKIAHRLSSVQCDRIIVFSSQMAEYAWHISTIPKLIDCVDVDSEKWRHYAKCHSFPLSWIYRLEADRLARYEEKVARVFDRCIFVSRKEASVFQERVRDQRISFISNGVDLDYFQPNGDDSFYSDRPLIVFTGAMDYFPNVDAVRYFCKEIFPLVREASPEAWFYIVGRNPTREVRELSRQANVIVTGSVRDVRPYLAKARVGVAPLRIARGVQNKVLEAMAMGVPVVGTVNAFQGIQATSEDGIRIGDDPEGFAREVINLLNDHGLRLRCSLQARHYVEHWHRWQDHGCRLESLLQGMS